MHILNHPEACLHVQLSVITLPAKKRLATYHFQERQIKTEMASTFFCISLSWIICTGGKRQTQTLLRQRCDLRKCWGQKYRIHTNVEQRRGIHNGVARGNTCDKEDMAKNWVKLRTYRQNTDEVKREETSGVKKTQVNRI